MSNYYKQLLPYLGVMFSILLLSAPVYADGAKGSNTCMPSNLTPLQDSLSFEKQVKADLNEIQKYIQLTSQQKNVVTLLLENRYHFVHVPHTSSARKKLTLGKMKAQLTQILGKDKMDTLSEAGVIDTWFDVDNLKK